METTMNGAGDMAAAAAAGNLESSGYYGIQQLKGDFDIGASSGKAISGNVMSESNYNYVIAPDFSANSNPAFVEDDEGALEEGERSPVYPILDGRGSRGQGVAPLSSAQPHGLTNEMVIKYVKAADYEELPHHTSAAGIQDEMSGYTHIDDGSVVVGTGPFHRSGGGGGAVAIPDGKQQLVSPKKGIDVKTRRRSNPLYDFPVTRFPVSEYPRGTQGPCGSSWVCCAFHTLVFLLAVAALVLAIINIVSKGGGGQNDVNRGNSSDANYVMQELLRSNSQLQKTIVDLQFKVQSLETAFQLQNGFHQNLSSQVDSQTKQMSRLDAEATNFTNAVDFIKKDLSYQISQVPRGLVNLTSCGHHLESTGTSVRQTLTTTNSLNLTGSAVFSVVCSTDGGTQALLRSDRNSLNVYSCECSGQTNSSIVSRYCIIHFWICPILP